MREIANFLQQQRAAYRIIPIGSLVLLLSYSLVAFGSPMPAKITWLEILMGSGLLIAALALVRQVIQKAQQQSSATWNLILVACLLFIPLCVGVMRGNAWSDIVRDIIPLTFLLVVPILLTYSASLANLTTLRTLITATLVFVGICTTIVFFMGLISMFGSIDEMVRATQEELTSVQVAQAPDQRLEIRLALFLKPYDPAMLFTSIFLGAWGVVLMVNSWRGWLPGMMLTGGGALIAYGFMVLGLRAYTALFALSILIMCLLMVRERGLYLRFIPFVIVASVILLPHIEAALQLLWAKQQTVGANGKGDEWTAVIATVLSSPQTALFGIGWGGALANPIYLNETTRFTHSVLSFYLFKSGVVGLIMLLSILAILLLQGRRLVANGKWNIPQIIMLLSCLSPLLIGVLFQPTYKMLSYGVILALFSLSSLSFSKISPCIKE